MKQCCRVNPLNKKFLKIVQTHFSHLKNCDYNEGNTDDYDHGDKNNHR